MHAWKKTIVTVLIALGAIIVLRLPYFVDDLACDNYKKSIESSIAGVTEIEVLDILNGCGNVANGDHTFLIVNVLIKTDLTKEDIKSKCADAYDVVSFNDLYSESKTSKHFSPYITDDVENYYVVVYAKSAPFYWFDLRGH